VLWLWLGLETRPPRAPLRRPRAKDYFWLAIGGGFLAGDLAAWHWAIGLTSVANSTLFANTAPIHVTLGAWLLLGERIRGGFLLGLGLALAGATLLMVQSLNVDVGLLEGDGLGLLTGFFYGGYVLCVKHMRASLSTATIMAWTSLIAVPPLIVLSLLWGEGFLAASLAGWGVLIGLGVVVHAGGQSLISFALAHLPASFSSVGLFLQPVAAALLAWLILSEPISPLQAVGAAVVLAGILIAKRYSG
jgi:drug/metabolite transporter (DMT)-like permease